MLILNLIPSFTRILHTQNAPLGEMKRLKVPAAATHTTRGPSDSTAHAPKYALFGSEIGLKGHFSPSRATSTTQGHAQRRSRRRSGPQTHMRSCEQSLEGPEKAKNVRVVLEVAVTVDGTTESSRIYPP